MSQPAAISVLPENRLYKDCHHFSHHAMATVFEIYIAAEDAKYAGQAALAAFNELDLLEQELSRFIESSDISRINSLLPGQSTRVGPNAFECLQICQELYTKTGGGFDITVGALVDCWRNADKSTRMPSPCDLEQAGQRIGLLNLELDETEHTVKLAHTHAVAVDLGGFGKGYAIDKVAELLQDWDIENALIYGGRSSIFAISTAPDEKSWPVTISHPHNPQQVFAHCHLQNRALSGSGLQKGKHIIDPRTGKPLLGHRAAWAQALDTATSDALSTAFMVMSCDEIAAYCGRHREISALLLLDSAGDRPEGDRVLRFGKWNSEL